ncbi:MAG: alpha-glucosidase [Alphaproteobacteria bacterium]|nr:alpha-glucosidase [Alphaproteobacteria bacterium]MDE2350875.1 alpha-glucosidase [Alphaproteobacteria bacterium]
MTAGAPWWRGAVIYQVYVRSFADGNGDGQGDFSGLRCKLGYLAGLGVDAIWLSPIHPSPNRDWGYDVSDFDGVHPDYGTQEEFDLLLSEAHALGLKVMTDEVLAHTSDEHPWFLESLTGRDKANWYVWADPKPDGTAPNNWLSAFAGPAWSYQPARQKYYHHKFLRQQPKLNWREPAARAAVLAVLERWLLRGVDGFRLDVANAYLHDPALTGNPPVPLEARTLSSWAHPPNMQFHYYDSNLPENIEVLDEVRRTVERHPDRFVMGEFSEEAERCGCYAAPDEGLHSGYSFPLLEARALGARFIREHYAMLARHPRHWPSIAFSNHDVMRTVSRFGGEMPPAGLDKLLLALLLSLRGTALLYQGEELGLTQAQIPRAQQKDPVGDLYYPYVYGRDGCRTPMPWDGEADNLGFGTGTPWLPAQQAHRKLAVSAQLADPGSALNFARRFLTTRKASAALRLGDIAFLDLPEPLLAFTRTDENERVLCVFNMSGDEQTFAIADAATLGVGCGATSLSGRTLQLGPYAAWFGTLL